MTPFDLSAPHEQDVDAVRRAIAAFAAEHHRRPFGALREIGVQAALKRLVDQELGDASSVDAAVVDDCNREIIGHPSKPLAVNTDRVRLEAKIVPVRPRGARLVDESGGDDDAQQKRQERTDLIVYRRHGVRLVRYPNGPGDIVYQAFVDSVLAAVEIKADPSHTAAQKRGYGKDIARLLRQREAGIHGFFVFLDKSSSFYGEIERRPGLDCIDWEPDPGRPASLDRILRGRSRNRADYSDWSDIWISRKRPGGEFVEIHDIVAKPNALLHAYRSRREQP